MTEEELRQLLEEATWFSNLGRFSERPGYVVIKGLEAWTDGGSARPADEEIADAMSWLPSSPDEPDPLGASPGKELSKQDETSRRFSMEAYKLALRGLRGCEDDVRFRVGPHDFSGAARGAALYATRAAATEVAVGKPGRWCELVRLYADGFWPCGLMPDGRVVVL